MTEWRSSTWGEEISLEYGKALRGYGNATGEVQVYGTNGPVGWTDEPLAPGPGVILGRKGAYRGVHFSPQPFFVIDTAYYVVPKTELDMRWLYFAMIYHKLGEIDDGSPIPSTTRSAVYHRELKVPHISEQRAIAAVLGSLDDKIELNRRMNETLEAMARALFKSWFVDFDPVLAKMEGRETGLVAEVAALFPHFLDADSQHNLPAGWRYVPLAEVTAELRRGIPPKYIEQGGVCVVNQRCVRGRKVSFDESRRHNAEQRAIDGRELEEGDILINSTGVGTLGRVGQIWTLTEPSVADSHITIVRARDGISKLYLGQNLSSRETEIEALGEGSTGQTELNRKRLGELPILVPPGPVLDAFDEFAEPVIRRMAANDEESRTLASLRDLLLPKLISGELHIGNAECLVGELGA
ncbi:restriction endonuclease subunit S [Sinorhizobium meliloti]|uniref:restriction endonuclease subunit S n=1 Tax=Rhizobium meliloti TaxID=382 RepID=UPI000FDA8717|nr:restriction endonuclease subunit S [Sinorhizobium meliloti]RVG26465.1 restriction endonuclease subunit S [Sinorhizobium meliloti]